jgi:hypothetical protein
MSPEQLKVLQHLSRLFEDGVAGPRQIKELSALLAEINKSNIQGDMFTPTDLVHSRSNTEIL